MAFKVLQVDHIGIGVSDLAATKEFYKKRTWYGTSTRR